jgi:hypothetical protein
MAIKKRPSIINEAKKLADELADRPYGHAPINDEEEYVVTSISITKSLLYKAEDLVKSNKRANNGPKSVSALVRGALEQIIS